MIRSKVGSITQQFESAILLFHVNNCDGYSDLGLTDCLSCLLSCFIFKSYTINSRSSCYLSISCVCFNNPRVQLQQIINLLSSLTRRDFQLVIYFFTKFKKKKKKTICYEVTHLYLLLYHFILLVAFHIRIGYTSLLILVHSRVDFLGKHRLHRFPLFTSDIRPKRRSFLLRPFHLFSFV